MQPPHLSYAADQVLAPRCGDSRCRLLGVALAVLEIDAHAFKRKQPADIRWLEAEANRSCLSAIVRDGLLNLARNLGDAPQAKLNAAPTANDDTKALRPDR